jgi:hypothetical protein
MYFAICAKAVLIVIVGASLVAGMEKQGWKSRHISWLPLASCWAEAPGIYLKYRRSINFIQKKKFLLGGALSTTKV